MRIIRALYRKHCLARLQEMQRFFVWACVCVSVMLLVATMKLVSSDPQAVFYTHYHTNFQQSTPISIGPRSLLACGAEPLRAPSSCTPALRNLAKDTGAQTSHRGSSLLAASGSK